MRVRFWGRNGAGVAKKLGGHRRKMREALANTDPARSYRQVRKRPQLAPAAAFNERELSRSRLKRGRPMLVEGRTKLGGATYGRV